MHGLIPSICVSTFWPLAGGASHYALAAMSRHDHAFSSSLKPKETSASLNHFLSGTHKKSDKQSWGFRRNLEEFGAVG